MTSTSQCVSALVLTSAAMALSWCSAVSAEPRSDGQVVRINSAPTELPTDRMIVKYKNANAPTNRLRAQSATEVAANRQGVSFSVLRQLTSGAQVLQLNRFLSPQDAESLAHSLRTGDAQVDYAEPDKRLMPSATPNDPMLSQQWNLTDAVGGIRATSAWDQSTGTGVTVAVIDTGVRPHIDLMANLLPGYDFIKDAHMAGDGDGRDTDAQDPGDGVAAGACGSNTAASNSTWHGTHVAGIVAAVAGNQSGVAGVAPGAKVLPLRAMGRCGGYASDVADAIVWASGGRVAGLPVNLSPAKVINLSLGGPGPCDRTSQDAIDAARARGVVVVVAAGNANTDAASASPANCSGVIAVAATHKGGGKASYSNFGTNVVLAAPGGDRDAGIWSTLNLGAMAPGADAYAAYAGTSMATPVVSAVVALMMSANKNLTPEQVLTLLQATARAFPAPCAGCGAGLVDAQAAVAAAIRALPAPARPPAPSTPAPDIQAAATPMSTGDLEPNDSLASAQNLGTLTTPVLGALSSNSDNDYFLITLNPGTQLTISLTPSPTLGTALGVYRSNGQLLRLFSGTAGQTQRVQLNSPRSNTLPVVLRVLRSSGTAGAYRLTFSP
jgi:serine protease